MTRPVPQFNYWTTETDIPPLLFQELGVEIAPRSPKFVPEIADLRQCSGVIVEIEPTPNWTLVRHIVQLAYECQKPVVFIAESGEVEAPSDLGTIRCVLNLPEVVKHLLRFCPDYHPLVGV